MILNELYVDLNEGITHIEDLSEDEFLRAVKNLNSWEISEKVDGAAMRFGFDDDGFFTSRENKGDDRRIRNGDEWGTKFMSTGFRSAHDALKKLMTPLRKRKIIQTGDVFSVEILFGKLPNAVLYSGEINQIILLSKDSEKDSDEARKSLEHMNKVLEDHEVTVQVENVPYTENGISINRRDEEHEWVVAVVPKKRADQMSNEEAQQIVDEEVKKIEVLLDRNIKVGEKELLVKEVIAIPLNKKPDWLGDGNWKEIKALVKEKQEEIKKALMSSKLEIKNQLLSAFVHNQQSDFGPDIENGGWIEGVVAKDQEGAMTKIVDKEGFTSINNYNWLVRNDIYDSRNSESVVMKMRHEVANVMGHGPLSGAQAKRYAKKFGNSAEEQTVNLASDMNFPKVKKVFVQQVKVANKELLDNLENFKNKTGQYANIDYQEGVKERTLQTFAETHELLADYLKALKTAKTPEDLIVIFAGDKLSSITTEEYIDEGIISGVGKGVSALARGVGKLGQGAIKIGKSLANKGDDVARVATDLSKGGRLTKLRSFYTNAKRRGKTALAVNKIRSELQKQYSELGDFDEEQMDDLIALLAHESVTESIIMEGGRAIEGGGAIYIGEIPATLKEIAKAADIPFSEIKNGTLGSVGKAKFSGDIDIALDDGLHDKQEVFNELKKAGLNPRLGAVISFPMKIAGYDESINDQTDKERTGMVQVDFMFGNANTLKFGYHSAGDKSKYKGVLRTILIASMASAMNQIFYDEGDDELVGRFGPAFAPSTGLNIRAKLRPRKKLTKKEIKQGVDLASKPRLKGEQTVDIENFKKEFTSVEIDKFGKKWSMDNPNDIAQFLFGDVKTDVTAADLDRVETIMPLLKKKPIELRKIVFQRFKERLEGDGIPIPKELEI